MFYTKGLSLCLWGEAIQIVVYLLNKTSWTHMVAKHLMNFSNKQNLLFHTIKFLVVLYMCSSTNKDVPSWMLRTPNLCLLDTTLQAKAMDFGSSIQKGEKKVLMLFLMKHPPIIVLFESLHILLSYYKWEYNKFWHS